MGILYSILFIQGIFWWDALISLEKNVYCGMIPLTIIGGLFILSFSGRKRFNMNKKQFLIIWTTGVIFSLLLFNILFSNKVEFIDEVKHVFWGIMVPTTIIGSLLIYTVRNRE